MGAFYNSICLPTGSSSRVRESLVRWLALRGFERVPETTLFDLDGETERSAFLLSNERWMVVVYSKYEEEHRLIRELQTWANDVVYVWVQDSDVWGYDLFDGRGFVGSFASDPRTYQSFRDEPFPSERRPVADAEELCRRFGLAGQAEAVRRIERRSARFEEDVCLDFCQLLGIEAAMVSYDDLERGLASGLEGWTVEHLLFRHRDALRGSLRVALHDYSVAGSEGGVAGIGQRSATDIIPSLPEAMRQVRQRSRGRFFLLRPLTWLAREWRRWLGEPVSPLTAKAPRETSSFEDERALTNGRRLVSLRHGCAIELAPQAEPVPVSGKPAAVFTFRIGETVVTCTSRRPDKVPEVLQRPNRAEILIDDCYSVGGFAARHVLFQLPPLYLVGRPEASYLGLHVIETSRALYVFLYRSSRDPERELRRAIQQTVASFRLQPSEGSANPEAREISPSRTLRPSSR